MTGKKGKRDKSISVWDDIAEWRKDPEYMREYEALEEEFAEVRRQMLVNRARRERREALVARVREGVLSPLVRVRGFWRSLLVGVRDFWHWLTRGVDRVTT